MDVLWARSSEEPTAREIAESFPDLAHTTVATMLDRLTVKGLVRYRKEGRTRHFSAVGSRADYTAMSMYESLRTTDAPEAALVGFAELVSPGEGELLLEALRDRLRKAVTRLAGNDG